MTLLLDTSVLVAALVETHAAHERAFPWLQRVISGADVGVVSAHSLAETYSTLTSLPGNPRISPAEARQLIDRNVVGHFTVVALSAQDYSVLIERVANLGITGGAVYDAVILEAAAKAGADQIITLNERHFRRVRPDLTDRIVQA